MNIQWLKLWEKAKEFLAFPAAKQVIIIFLGIVFICGVVILYLYTGREKDRILAKQELAECNKEKDLIQKEYSDKYADTVKVLLQRFEQDKTAIYVSMLERVDKDFGEALQESREAMSDQKRAKAKLQRITSKVSKIVKNADK